MLEYEVGQEFCFCLRTSPIMCSISASEIIPRLLTRLAVFCLSSCQIFSSASENSFSLGCFSSFLDLLIFIPCCYLLWNIKPWYRSSRFFNNFLAKPGDRIQTPQKNKNGSSKPLSCGLNNVQSGVITLFEPLFWLYRALISLFFHIGSPDRTIFELIEQLCIYA